MNSISKDKDLEQIQLMKPTQWRYINWHEEGGGEVQRVHDVYVLFEIPSYGGEPQYFGTFNKNELSKMVDVAHSWT